MVILGRGHGYYTLYIVSRRPATVGRKSVSRGHWRKMFRNWGGGGGGGGGGGVRL